MSYLIHDAETSIYESYKRKANPFDPRNWVVANGFKRPADNTPFHHYYGSDMDACYMPLKDEDQLLVGFNYKFDLLWHWHRPELQAFLKRGGKIWCCQYAEYLLEGQIPTSQMCSLNELSAKYGGTQKMDIIKEMWSQGIQTVDIPEDVLLDYLDDDISNTEIVFLAQLKRAREQGQLVDILGRMEGLLGTTEMEYKRVYVDIEQATKDKEMIEGELACINAELEASLPEMPPELVFNWGSNIHKSCLLFGGWVKYEKWTPHLTPEGAQIYAQMDELCYLHTDGRAIPCETIHGRFGQPVEWTADVKSVLQFFKGGKKKGEPKTKKVKVDNPDKPKGAKKEYFHLFEGVTVPEEEWKGKLTDGKGGPIYSTGKDVVEGLGTRNIPFLTALANREKLAKDLGTYYLVEDGNGKQTGMLTTVMPDGIIHHKLNHTITVTSRLSSSDPNLQNVSRADFDKALGRPKSVVKRMFTSRFGPDGRMAEVDYSQLEVVVQGLLTGDPTLVKDIQNKVDFHCKRLSAKLHEDYEAVKEKAKNEEHPDYESYSTQRTKIKGFTFQRAYGAGAKAIAASTGMSLEEVEDLIGVEERLYPGITAFYDQVEESCERTRYPTKIAEELPDKPGVYVQCGRGYYQSPTQARFVFTEQPNYAWLRSKTGRDAAFYRPHIQNYPIQGVGGQLVQYILGALFRHLLLKDNYGNKVKMVNTVHDCVWFDFVDEEAAKQILPELVQVMESIPAILKQMFRIECTVPFPVDAELGANMLDLHHF